MTAQILCHAFTTRVLMTTSIWNMQKQNFPNGITTWSTVNLWISASEHEHAFQTQRNKIRRANMLVKTGVSADMIPLK